MAYVWAVVHGKKFLVVKTHKKEHSTYTVHLLKRNGQISKHQTKGLCDRVYTTQGHAKHNIRMWDLSWL